MHPVLARFIKTENVLAVLRKGSAETFDPEERFLLQAAARVPGKSDVILSGKWSSHPPPQVQEATLFLGAYAALCAVEADPEFQAPMMKARQVLKANNATDPQVDSILASLLMEEAFGYEDEADTFDGAFFLETIQNMESLVELDIMKIAALQETFVASVDADWKDAAEQAASRLFEAAWSDGPEPINPEHVEEVIASADDDTLPVQRTRLLESLRQFIDFLQQRELMGPIRAERLTLQVADALTETAESA